MTRQNENQVHSIRTGEKEEGEKEKERLCVLETIQGNTAGSAQCSGSQTDTTTTQLVLGKQQHQE